MRLNPVDRLSFTYLTVVCLLLAIFHARVPRAWFLISLFLAYGGVIVLILEWSRRCPRSRTARFFRLTYPVWATFFTYKIIGGYVLILHGHFLDAQLAGFEKTVLGFHPTLALQPIISPPLTEFLKFAYFSYYAYMVVPPLLLFLHKRDRDLEQLVFNIALAFYVSYLGFLVLPVAGPRYLFAGVYAEPHLSGYAFTALQDFIMAHGDTLGACFPSSHVAVAWIILLSIRTFFGPTPFWIILPFTLSLTFSVVYHRYHYASDAVAGWLVAVAGFAFSRWVYGRERRRGAMEP